MFRAEGHSVDFGVNIAHMANSLANSKVHFRALTDVSENFRNYVTPYGFIPAFNLAQDQIRILDRAAYENFTALVKNHIHWDNSRAVLGWQEYTNAEKLEYFGSWYRLTLTEISFHLLLDRKG